MQIKEYSTLEIKGATWKHVTTALGGFNACECDPEEVLAALRKAPATRVLDGLEWIADNDVVLVADHSVGDRSFDLEGDWHNHPWIKDQDFNGAWLVATAETVSRLEFASASSGSRILASRRGDEWTITGSFPIVDGERYEGAYFKAFMEAAEISVAERPQRDALMAIRGARERARTDLHDALRATAIPDMDSYQGWDLVTREYATPDEVAEATAILAGLGWEATEANVYGYGEPVKVLAARPAGGWNDGEQLAELAEYGWREYPYGPQVTEMVPLLTIQVAGRLSGD
jgi:hypothetical protein